MQTPPVVVKNTEAQWRKKHAAALSAADTARQARDMHPVMSPPWVHANDTMLRADALASYAYRKINESIVRNGGTPPQDALLIHPDLTTPSWRPAIKAATKAYRRHLTPPAPAAPPPPGPITPHSISSVPRTARDSKQTCEYLFTYWTRRVEHATNMRDQARQAGRSPKLIAKWQRAINVAHARRAEYTPARKVAHQPRLEESKRSNDQ